MQTSLISKEVLIVDIETTGFNERTDFILELGMCKLDILTGEITKMFDETFREPGLTHKHTKAWIFENGFMDLSDIRSSKSIEFYREEIQAILDCFQGDIIAWNRKFDAKFLVANNFKLGPDALCPMVVSTKYFKLPKKSGKGFKWPSAQEAWNILFPETPKTELHRGYDDSVMEAKIIHELMLKGAYHPNKKV